MIKQIRRERRPSQPLSLSVAGARHTALLLLNWQHDALAQDGALHRQAQQAGIDLTGFDAHADRALQYLSATVLPACRAKYIDIIHVPSSYWKMMAGLVGERSAVSGRRTDIQVHGDCHAQPDELIVLSTSISPFNSTGLDLLLRNLEIEQLLIAGLLTNGSVELTAQDARDRGYEVIIIEDACAAFTSELHRAAIGRIRTSAIAVAEAATVADHLRSGQLWPAAVGNQVAETHPIFVPDPEPELAERRRPAADAASMALVTVDMQYLNAHPEWGVGRELRERGLTLLEEYFSSVQSVLPNVRKVQEMFRQADLPLIHLRTACLHPDERDSGRHRKRNRDPMAALGSKETEFLPEVAPDDAEIVVNKTSWGVFNSTDIETVLHRLAIRHIVLVGVVTNGCVEMAARDALDRGFTVTVVREATTTRSVDLHLDALYRLENCGAIIQDSTSLLACLSPRSQATFEAAGSTIAS